jgi:hypothetical protein
MTPRPVGAALGVTIGRAFTRRQVNQKDAARPGVLAGPHALVAHWDGRIPESSSADGCGHCRGIRRVGGPGYKSTTGKSPVCRNCARLMGHFSPAITPRRKRLKRGFGTRCSITVTAASWTRPMPLGQIAGWLWSVAGSPQAGPRPSLTRRRGRVREGRGYAASADKGPVIGDIVTPTGPRRRDARCSP